MADDPEISELQQRWLRLQAAREARESKARVDARAKVAELHKRLTESRPAPLSVPKGAPRAPEE